MGLSISRAVKMQRLGGVFGQKGIRHGPDFRRYVRVRGISGGHSPQPVQRRRRGSELGVCLLGSGGVFRFRRMAGCDGGMDNRTVSAEERRGRFFRSFIDPAGCLETAFLLSLALTPLALRKLRLSNPTLDRNRLYPFWIFVKQTKTFLTPWGP